MNTESSESPLKIKSLDEFGAYMTKEKVAKALDIGVHNIPVLVRAGLLRPKGNPQRYCVKKISRSQLARNLADEAWLDKAAAAIHQHWRNKNARKRATLAGNGLAQPNGNPVPTAAEVKAGESVTR
ncbi:MAG TPA: hypothetical protein VIK53_13260 [Verrucomicrobiae bacterium]